MVVVAAAAAPADAAEVSLASMHQEALLAAMAALEWESAANGPAQAASSSSRKRSLSVVAVAEAEPSDSLK